MDLNLIKQNICKTKLQKDEHILKRKLIEEIESNKKFKIDEVPRGLLDIKSGAKEVHQHLDDIKNEAKEADECNELSMQKLTLNGKVEIGETLTKVPTSPRKRLELPKSSDSMQQNKDKYIYGNYSQYYGYRNSGHHDIRLDVFMQHKNIFENKHILDIGCNSGLITVEIAKKIEIKSIVGLDIDKSLINQAIKNLSKLKKALPLENEFKRLHKFPFNIKFVHGNYVLKDDVLLEIETSEFDVILCLSITKWIHLNFGDDGLKQAFKRMFLQLKPQGKLILEAQPYDNYGRRKKITDTIFRNFKNIKFFPKDFTEYLLSTEIGFAKVELMAVPDHCKKGFKRPIQIFFKN